MSLPRKTLAVGVALLLVLALGIVLGWFARRPPLPPPSATTNVAAEKPASTNRSPFFAKRAASRPGAGSRLASTNPPLEHTSAVATNLITDWEEKIDEVLRSNAETAAMGRTLLELLPRFPKAGQVEAAQHIANLLEDDDYAPLAKVLADPTMPEEVLDILLADLLNRPNALKLPALLSIARQTDHPQAREAKDLLELYLEEDFGSDWAQWETRMQAWLKANPD
jgi:hypothetical protein